MCVCFLSFSCQNSFLANFVAIYKTKKEIYRVKTSNFNLLQIINSMQLTSSSSDRSSYPQIFSD